MIESLSTVISDGVLAAVTLACGAPLLRSRNNPTRTFAAACFVFIGLSAAVGAARFAGMDLALYHSSLSWTSSRIAVPMLGATFLALSLGRRVPRPIWYALGFALGLAGWALPPSLGVVPGAAGMLAIVAGALLYHPHDRRVTFVAIAGVVLYLVAGLLIGTKGTLGPFLRVDLFHYGLAIAHPPIAWAMLQIEDRRHP